jgi:hypothetical protein
MRCFPHPRRTFIKDYTIKFKSSISPTKSNIVRLTMSRKLHAGRMKFIIINIITKNYWMSLRWWLAGKKYKMWGRNCIKIRFIK